MKEKLKKFWSDNKDAITDYAMIATSIGVVVITSGGIAWLEATRRANNKNHVTGADVYMNLSGSKNQSIIIVDHKDKTQTRLESDGHGIFDVLERRWLQLEQSRAVTPEASEVVTSEE
jgi:Flp pilus assembly pilin Flp